MNLQAIKEKTVPAFLKVQEALTAKAAKIKEAFVHPKGAMQCFYWLLIVANLCFIYTWVQNGFTVPLGGDYSIQEMTFLYNGYDDWHYFFRTGIFPQWDRTTFLGIDNIGGNSFYYLFDPFFLVLLIFPRNWLLVLQGLSFVPKMVVAGMFFYWYLGEFKLSSRTRTIGAMAFAFSGYSMVYLWFHFISSVAFLPLVFLGIERILRRQDPRIFLVGFFLVAMSSYFFLAVYMIGAFLYAMFRYFQRMNEHSYGENMSTLGVGMLSFITAVCLGAFVLLPGMMVAIGMPRVEDSSYLDSLLGSASLGELLHTLFIFPQSQQHNQVTPLLNFLFMADDCYSSNLLNVNYYDNLAGSLYATTPMLLLTFVSLLDAFREKKISYILGFFLMGVLTMTPIGFYLFSAFTVAYARFFIIPISFMVTWNCLTIERREKIPTTYMDLSMVIVSVLYVIACYLLIYEVEQNSSRFNGSYWDVKMVLIIFSSIFLAVCYFVMRPLFHKKSFSVSTLGLMSLNIVIMANATIYGHGLSNISKMSDYPIETKIVEMLKESENGEDYYRIYNTSATRNNPNVSFREGYSGLAAFHSVYPFEAQDFLDRSRIPHGYRNWSMGIYNRRENLETFLGTKYYLLNRVDPKFVSGENPALATPRAYPYRNDENGYAVWATDYDIPYGYKNVLDLTEAEKQILGVDYQTELLDLLSSDECTKSLYVNMNFTDLGFSFDSVMNTAWLATNLSYKKYDDPFTYNLYEDINEYPLLRTAMLDDEDFNRFVYENKFDAGTVNFFGDNYPSTDIIEDTPKLKDQARKFQDLISSVNKDYVPYDPDADYIHDSSLTKPSTPIQIFSSSTSQYAKMKTTVYAANWPATESRPSGEYAQCDPENPYDTSCLEEYKKEHPWEYANGIRPADTVYDFDDSNFDKKVLYNSKIVITPYDGKGNPTVFCPDADPEKPGSGSYISIFSGNQIEWRFFDENDHLISFAQHSGDSVKYKTAHGYYVDRPVAKILGIVKEGNKTTPCYLSKPYVYITRDSDYQRAVDELKQYSIQISKRNENETYFSTNYDEERFVVLNIPLQKGWTVDKIVSTEDGKTKYEPVETYKAQGGFIGFVADVGPTEYVVSYATPYFKLGCLATLFGIFIYFLFVLYFASVKHRQKRNGIFEKSEVERIREENL